MQLAPEACEARLGTSGHGVLGTVHPERGVDAVPVVYVVVDGEVVMPIDTVKPKADRRLQRLVNLDADDRAVLLVEHYHDDWSRLWWVRVHGHAHEATPAAAQAVSLAHAFPAYGAVGAVTSVIVLPIEVVTGWSAAS
jgi:PPOX class probable F420-dependent enzyme